MEDNISQASNSKILEGASGTITWTLENWNIWQQMLAKEADCILNIKDVKLRFFFRLFSKGFERFDNDPKTPVEYYALCVQILSYQNHVSLRIQTNCNNSQSSEPRGLYYVNVQKSATNQYGCEVVDDEFLKIGVWHTDYRNGELRKYGHSSFKQDMNDLKITITATLCFCDKEASTNTKSVVAEERINEGSPVTREMQRVLQAYPEKPFADVSLKMQDNVTIQGHRLILASASPVFETMFTSGLKETQNGMVEIPDVSSKVMKILIKYMHSGNVDLPLSVDNHLLEQVIYAASKYQLRGLVEYFDTTLITLCNPGNVVGLLKLAKQHNLPNATVELENYTKLNALEIVMEQIKKV